MSWASMNAPLFRHEVIEAGRERLSGTVVAATPPRARLYLALVIGVVAILVAILAFGTYTSRAAARGVVAFDGGVARVYPNASGEIRAVHVQEGTRVEAGAPLVTIALAQGANGVGDQLALVDEQDVALADQQRLAASLAETEARTLEGQRDALATAIASLRRQQRLAADQIRLAEAGSRRAARLAAEGAGSRRQAEESRAAVIARRAEAESLTERIAAQDQALRALSSQAAERRLEGQRRTAELAAQRAGLGEQRAALARTDRLVLTAPVAGEVGDLAGEIGQRARPEVALVTLIPAGSRTEVWLYANSEAVGSVAPGQAVKLNFDAFPYQRHGSGHGIVTAVSRVAVEPAALDPALGIQEPVFRIRVAIERLPPAIAAGVLRPGTTVSANLILRERSLWEALFNPISAAFG